MIGTLQIVNTHGEPEVKKPARYMKNLSLPKEFVFWSNEAQWTVKLTLPWGIFFLMLIVLQIAFAQIEKWIELQLNFIFHRV